MNISPSAIIAEIGVVTTSDFSGVGTALTGITKGDLSWLFRSNIGVLDSKTIGELSFSGNALVTTIVTSGVFVDINATFSAGSLERFTQSGDELTYIGLGDVEVEIIATSSIDPSGNDISIATRIMLNGSQIGVVGNGFAKAASRAGSTPAATTTLVTGDVISIQVANTTAASTDDVVVEDLLLIVLER